MLKPTIYFYTFALCFFLSPYFFAQNTTNQIPDAYRSHPELGKFNHSSPTQESMYELIHDRTAFSRTFLNTNKTKTTVRSSSPMHYKNENGLWMTRDYELFDAGGMFIFPKQNPELELLKSSGQTKIIAPDGDLYTGANKKISFIGTNGQIVSSHENLHGAITKLDTKAQMNNLLDGLHWSQQFYTGAIKTDFILSNKNAWPNDFTILEFEEKIVLPTGYSMLLETENGESTNRVLVLDAQGNQKLVWQQPIVSDAKEVAEKFRHDFVPHQALYEIEQIGETEFLLRMKIPAAWLNDPERVFPIIIDPVVTVESSAVINSCSHPNYQQATMTVNVPDGETVFSTDINYNFVAVAGSQGWMSDQRSFVQGPNGQTGVLSGAGDQAGTFVYNITNSEIGNVTSTGSLDFTFNFARTWGGSGCNATFNLVNYREIIVHHGTIEFGDGPILINEYSASNRNFVDGFNRTEDWIEIYNAHPTAFFDMTGYHLSNDADDPTMWQIPGGFIAPDSRVLVYCSKRNIASGMVFHANFNLTQLRPDQIILADPDGNVMEQLDMFVTQINHSYGRLTDGGDEWGVFSTPTPGQANNNGFLGYTPKPTFDVEPGHYDDAVTVSLAVDGNFQIRYTTNGATPNASSTVYSGPINVSQTTVIRARAFSADPTLLPGFIETNTYLIDENHTLPVFSFAGDPNMLQLFNGNASLRPIGHFEYFEKDGTFIDENLGDFNKHGNDSWNYAQRGVDFISRDDYGYNRRLEHKFFATSDRTRFRRLMVKAAANDNYPHQTGGAHIRDSYIMTMSQLAGLELDERSSTNCIVYVNGQYWGVYDLRERVDDNNYTDFYFGQDYEYRDSDIYLQFLKTWGATQAHFGNQAATSDWLALRNYIQQNNMGDEQHFDYVDSQLDMTSFIDHFVLNSIIVSRDWLNYNTGWWRGLNPDGQAQKWRYICWDMEASTGHFHNYTGLPNTGPTAPPCQVENLTVGNGHAQSLKKLIDQNEQVRHMYVTRYIDLMNTHFSCENMLHVLDSMVDNIAPEMPRQIQRWGGNMNTWQANVQTLRNWLTDRCDYMINTGLANCYNLTGPFATTFDVFPENAGKIKMNTEWLTNFPFNAQLYGNIQTDLLVESYPGYEFSHWVVDGAVVTPDLFDIQIAMDITQATEITAHFTQVISPDDALIHYWHFNELETPNDVVIIPADYSAIADANPLMRYTGSGPRDIDAVNNGSDVNLHLNELAGRAARVRNPSDGRSLVFDLPTTGFEDIKFAYVVERTNNGMLKNILSYSLDGTNYTQAELPQTEFTVEGAYDLIYVDLSHIEGVEDNPNFRIRIEFEGNTEGLNGNNRFDNVSLKGIEMEPSSASILANIPHEVQLFPNPTTSDLEVRSSHPMKFIELIDLSGKIVLSQAVDGINQAQLQLNDLHAGVYLVRINTDLGVKTLRVIKQ